MICKHFGLLLINEIKWLCVVQMFFSFSFLSRGIATFYGTSIIYDNNTMWNYDFCVWTTLLPLGYDALPILVVYIQHIKHFKGRQSGLLQEVGIEGNEE